MTRAPARRLVFAAMLVLPACKNDPPAQLVTKTIGRDGGQISSHDGVLTLLFQPGSLTTETLIEVSPSDTPPLIFGPAYRVRPDIDLELPMDVTYRRVLPLETERAAVAAVHRVDFEAGSGAWTALPITELDEANDLVGGIDAEIALFYGMLERGIDPTATGSTSTTATPVTETTTGDPMTETSEAETIDPETGETETSGPLSYAADIEPIFMDRCTDAVCHAAGANNPNLADDGYENIINQPSIPAFADLVVPGDASASYLMHKLDATHDLDETLGGCGCAGAGLSMPQGEKLLPSAMRTRIREWIDAGAMP